MAAIKHTFWSSFIAALIAIYLIVARYKTRYNRKFNKNLKGYFGNKEHITDRKWESQFY